MSTYRILIPVLLLCLALPAGAQQAFAQISGSSAAQASDLFEKGNAAFEKGQFDLAVQSFGRALRASDLDDDLVARIMYRRGEANERAGRPAQAIADITAALYLPNFPAADRPKAYLSRGRAYEAVGMGEQARADIARARSGGVDERQIARSAERPEPSSGGGPSFTTTSSGSSRQAAAPSFRTSSETAPPPVPSFETQSRPTTPAPQRQRVAAFDTQARPAARASRNENEEIPRFRTTIVPDDGQAPAVEEPKQESTGRVGRFIGNLWSSATGDDKEASTPAPPVAPAAPQWDQQTTVARAPRPAAPSWSAQVSSPARSSTSAPAPAPAPRPATTGGSGYRIQLAALKTDAEAQQTWKRLRSRHGNLLAGHTHNIVRTELGGLGTFYRLQLGPFADKAQSQDLCKSFKAGGLDCFLLAP